MESQSKRQRRAQRHERKRQLLGQPKPTCSCCGHDDVNALQLHHVAGEANSHLAAFVCPNCPAALSDQQQDENRDILDHRVPRDPFLQCAGLLLGLKHLCAQTMPELDKQVARLLAASEYLRNRLGPEWHLTIQPKEDE